MTATLGDLALSSGPKERPLAMVIPTVSKKLLPTLSERQRASSSGSADVFPSTVTQPREIDREKSPVSESETDRTPGRLDTRSVASSNKTASFSFLYPDDHASQKTWYRCA